MINLKSSINMMAAVLFTTCLTSCESDEFGGG